MNASAPTSARSSPGSEQAKKLKQALISDGLWSQYLEVAIGPDAEIFTKSPTLSSVGWGDWIGVRSDSAWNNPEPEIVLAVDSAGRILGATLGNDVNLRDIEGRSALLLGKAKDNNASCAIGPFIRMFDGRYTLDDVRRCEVKLEIEGEEGFKLQGQSSMSQISRDPTELVGQTIGKHHCYPDGFALFLGTMFAPIVDRGAPGQGFTHKKGDIVRVSTREAGCVRKQGDHLRPGHALGIWHCRPDAQPGASRSPELLNGIKNVSETKQLTHYIDGQWVAGSPASDSLNPSDTRDVVARVPGGDKKVVDSAVAAAKAAFPAWANASPGSALGPARQGRAQ